MSEPDSNEQRQLDFIIQRLKMMVKGKYHGHYSPRLTILAFTIHAASAVAYNTLRDSQTLCLPSTSTLRKVSRRVGGQTGLDNTSYLKLRLSKLNEYKRTMLLIIDEIYVAERLEYSGGEVIGLTADGTVATTLLCFMIKVACLQV
jgi:Transposase protein